MNVLRVAIEIIFLFCLTWYYGYGIQNVLSKYFIMNMNECLVNLDIKPSTNKNKIEHLKLRCSMASLVGEVDTEAQCNREKANRWRDCFTCIGI